MVAGLKNNSVHAKKLSSSDIPSGAPLVCIIFPFSRSINGPHSYKYTYMYILHVAALRRCILIGGLNVYISHYFKYIESVAYIQKCWRMAVADSIVFI